MAGLLGHIGPNDNIDYFSKEKETDKLSEKQKELEQLQNRRNELFKLRQPIERELTINYNKISKIKDEITKILIDEKKLDWNYLLDESSGQESYKQYNKEVTSRGLHSGSYLPETGQRCITVCLTKNDNESYIKTLNGLQEILPFIKPFEKDHKGFKYINILEKTLSENGVYFLLLNEKKGIYKLMRTRYSVTKELKVFGYLEEIIKYVQKNHYYTTTEDNDDNPWY